MVNLLTGSVHIKCWSLFRAQPGPMLQYQLPPGADAALHNAVEDPGRGIAVLADVLIYDESE